MTQAFPLQWPTGRPRAKHRTASTFKVTPGQAYSELTDELHRWGATNVVVSTNIPLRRDGTPYRDGLDDRLPDPGVAVYFTKAKRAICIACDTYYRPWENMRAVGKSIEAFRAIERHGAGQILDQAFEGFTALPAPSAGGPEPWHMVLGCPPWASVEAINAAWRVRCREAGGATVELNAARDEGMRGVRP
jgi:hypothetical protein